MYSVVIAANAGDPYVGDALQSIQEQTLAPAQVTVVLDADSEPPAAWLASIRRDFPSVVVQQHPGHGQIQATTFGISTVTTPYIAFLDCDDLWVPEKQAQQIHRLQKQADLDAVTCLAVNESNGPSGLTASEPIPGAMFTCTTFRTEVFDRYGVPTDDAGRYAWLYRWWASARERGIRTETMPFVGLRRRIHDRNSWVLGNEQAHGELLSELRNITRMRREGHL